MAYDEGVARRIREALGEIDGLDETHQKSE